MDETKIVDADYRLVGEDKWAPFRRWLTPKLVDAAVWLVLFSMMFASLMAMRWFQGAW